MRAPAEPPPPQRASLPLLRWAVQALCAMFIVLVGVEFAAFHRAALDGASALPPRPAAVESLLPLSALLALKRFLATGAWDDLHPAGLAILLAVLASAVVARKAFCGWVCPVGTLSRALDLLGQRLGLQRTRRHSDKNSWASRLAFAPKYVLLAFFVGVIFLTMSLPAIEAFLGSPYNVSADARMLAFFAHPSLTAIVVVGAFVVGSLFVKQLWCRFFCPYGAFLGLFSWASPQKIVRDPDVCIHCERCTKGCPTGIVVHTELRILTPECTGCLDCVAACPVDDCLTVGRRGSRGWSPVWVPAGIVATLLAAWLLARATGHWTSKLPAERFAEFYRQAAAEERAAGQR